MSTGRAELIYGFDPLCGWCYGAVPAVRAARAALPDLPVRLVMSGLVTGARAGPYAEMEGYIRAASARLRAVTGRAPSEAFFDLIRTPGVVGSSAEPCVAIDAVRREAPEAALDYAHAVIESHFEAGADIMRRTAHEALLARMGLDVALPDLSDPACVEAAFAEGRALGIASFPTLALVREGRAEAAPDPYRPRVASRLAAGAGGPCGALMQRAGHRHKKSS